MIYRVCIEDYLCKVFYFSLHSFDHDYHKSAHQEIDLYVSYNDPHGNQTLAFMPFWSKTKMHQDITRDAILQATADVCKLQALQKGQNFVLVNKTFYIY